VPIRLRLALWHGLLLGCTLLIFCVVLFLALQAALNRDLDQVLRLRATQVERELISSQDQNSETELTPSEIQPDDLEPNILDDFAEAGVYVQVISLDAQVLASTGTPLPIESELIQQALVSDGAFGTLVVGGGQRLRTLYWLVRADGIPIAVVQVAETLQLLDETMQDARNLMFAGALAFLAAALGTGWFITAGALAPVAAITDAALHIAQTGRFDRRLRPGQPRDELSALAATFNVMTARIDEILTGQRQFLADTSHELRNPLSIIRGNLDYVRRVTVDQTCLESLHEAEQEAARMTRLVNDLLLLVQADAGEFLACAPLRLDLLAQEMGEQAQAMTDSQVIRVQTAEATWVWGDADRLRQVFWNLLNNALRHTPADGRITISVQQRDGKALLEVADSGAGVPIQDEARIFERFYRADPSRSRSTGGVGLGLAIVKHITEAHDGRVELRNRPGHGATFSVTLPLTSAPGPGAALADGRNCSAQEPDPRKS
jgi:signal transduction histidine kinase